MADGVFGLSVWGGVPGSVVVGGEGEAGVYGFVFARAVDFALLVVCVDVLGWEMQSEGEG